MSSPNSHRIEAVRRGCRAAEVHLDCSYPTCKCKQIPVAVLAALDGPDGSEVDLVFTADAIYVDTGVRSEVGGNKALKVKDEQAKRLLEVLRAQPQSEAGDSDGK